MAMLKTLLAISIDLDNRLQETLRRRLEGEKKSHHVDLQIFPGSRELEPPESSDEMGNECQIIIYFHGAWLQPFLIRFDYVDISSS
jgi:hypothetical protein